MSEGHEAVGCENSRFCWWSVVFILIFWIGMAKYPDAMVQFVGDVSEFFFINPTVVTLMIGASIALAFVFVVEWLWSFNWKLRKLDRIRHKVEKLRRDAEDWKNEADRHDQLLKDINSAKTKTEKQDLALSIEQSRIILQNLVEEKCHKAQERLDKIFFDLGYEFPTLDSKEKDLIEKYGAGNQ